MEKNRSDYWKNLTTQYNMRFTNDTGVPDAIVLASKNAGVTTAEYLKNAVVTKLKADGFLPADKNVVLNMNKQRHRDKIARLKEYIKQEELSEQISQKMK